MYNCYYVVYFLSNSLGAAVAFIRCTPIAPLIIAYFFSDKKVVTVPSDSTMVMSDGSYLMNEMACYLRADILKIILPDMPVIESNYQAQYSQYQLPLGELNLVELVIYLPTDMLPADIEALGRTAFNAVNIWRKTHISRSIDSQLRNIDVLVLDIQRQIDIDIDTDTKYQHKSLPLLNDLLNRMVNDFTYILKNNGGDFSSNIVNNYYINH